MQYCFAVPPANFAYHSDRNFMLNGKKIYFGGNNLYYLGINTSATRDDTLVAGCATKGVTVIRMWAYYNGDAGRIQPSLGVYTESALRELDYAIQDAETHGEKVILTLNNYWTDFNGMQWYVDQVEGMGHPESDFYTNAGCQTAFKNYINMLVNRTNFYTGVQYKNDPGIFSWELANEPRCPSDTTGTTLYNWIDMMASYIKGLDPNHMVSTGEEGFKLGGNGGDWTENGSTGNDFTRNISDANIDFATVHLYPTGWGKDSTWTNAFLTDRANIAHNTAHKPIVLEEYGEETSTGNRDSLFSAWHSLAQNATLDYDGLMPWQMEDVDSTSFTFSFGSSTGTLVGTMCGIQASKCEGATPVAPTAPTGVTATAGYLSVGLSWSGPYNATSYKIYRGTSAGGESTTPIATGVTTTNFSDTGLTNGVAYYYKISAVNSVGESPKSAEVSATANTIVTTAKYDFEGTLSGWTGAGMTGGPYFTNDWAAHGVNSAKIDVNLTDSTYYWMNCVANDDYSAYTTLSAVVRSATWGTPSGLWAKLYIKTGSTSAWYDAGAVNIGSTTTGTVLTMNLTSIPNLNQIKEIGIQYGTGSSGNSGSTSLYVDYVTLSYSGAPPTVPSAPTGLAATAGNTQVALSWTASSGATSYNVYRGTTAGGESATAVATGVTGTTYTNTGLINGTAYYYKVKAVNSAGTSGYSNEASATPVLAVPSAPTGLTATAGNTQVALSWTASSGAASYNVYRGTTAGGESTTAIATGITTTSYTNTGLTNGSTYYYKVKAVNASGTSGYSNEASATPNLAIPAAPTGLTATAGNAQVVLTWTASSGATSYNVYRGTTAGGESTTAVATGITTLSYTNTGLTNGTAYYYKVKAANSAGSSGYSNEATATPTAATLVIKYDFDSTIVPWVGVGQTGGPNCAPEWQYHGPYSAQIGVNYTNNASYFLKNTTADNFSGYSQLKAVLHCGAGGAPSGLWGKLYIKTGPTLQTFDSGSSALVVGTTVTMTINLTGDPNLNDIREIGVQWGTGASGNSGSGLLNVDYITLQ